MPEAQRHRISYAYGTAMGGIFMVSVYLKHTEGMSADNAAILDDLAASLATLNKPWIIGGDFNMSPEDLSASGWPAMVRGKVCAPLHNTCYSNRYDYFIVSESLAGAVHATQNIQDTGTFPHTGTRILMKNGAPNRHRRTLRKPFHIPGVLPCGPWPQPLSEQFECAAEPAAPPTYSSDIEELDSTWARDS